MSLAATRTRRSDIPPPRHARALAVVLAPLDLTDAIALHELASDPAIAATSNVPFPFSPAYAVRFIRESARRWRASRDFVFGIREEDRLVGVCSLLSVGGVPLRAELGYWIGRPFWGRGLASEAARRVVRYGFLELGLASIRSSCLLRNTASERVLEKTGFRQTGLGANANPKWPPSERFRLFELTREDWAIDGGGIS